MHDDTADNLLANEVADLNDWDTGLGILLNVDVDREMGIDVAHLVLEALGNADDHVVDQGADGTESGDILAGTVVKLDVDDILLWVGEVHCKMGQVLGELACELLESDSVDNLVTFRPNALAWIVAAPRVCVFTSWTLNRDESRLDGNLDCRNYQRLVPHRTLARQRSLRLEILVTMYALRLPRHMYFCISIPY